MEKKFGYKKLVGLSFFIVFLAVLVILSFSQTRNGRELKKVSVSVLPRESAMPLKSCPSGYDLVPRNKTYGTGDFCVMKYDAKCAYSSTPSVGIEPAPGNSCSGEGIYRNNGPGCACLPQNNKIVVSTRSGAPITYIPLSDDSANNAKSYCQSAGGHLMNNNEWMTIARNVEQVPQNWCDTNGTNCGNPPGTTGKILASGYNDSRNDASASGHNGIGAIFAGEDNQPCFGTTPDGSNKCGANFSQKRTLTLNNGNIVWDFAGNVWQWVDAQVKRKDEPESASNGVPDLGWIRSDFAPGSLPSVITNNGQGGVLGYDAMRPSNPNWNANNGVGRIYHYSNPKDTSMSLYAFIRGGNWRHGDDDGAFTIHLSPPSNTKNIDDVGFRCVTSL